MNNEDPITFNLDDLGIELDVNLIELEINRAEITKLSKELDEQKIENYMLKQQLDTANNKNKELEAINQLMEKKYRCIEEESERAMKMSKKNEIISERAECEKETLIKNLHKSMVENIDLKRNLENLKSKLHLMKLGEKKIVDMNENMKSVVADLRKKLDNVTKAQEMVSLGLDKKKQGAGCMDTKLVIQHYEKALREARNDCTLLKRQAIQLEAEKETLTELTMEKCGKVQSCHNEACVEALRTAYEQIKIEQEKVAALDAMQNESKAALNAFLEKRAENRKLH